jgi:HlyD family secretion protein
MSARTRPSGLVYTLGALCAGAVVAAFLVVGPSSESATTQSRVVTAQRGVVQATVSGSGNIQATTQLDLGFKTSGVVQHIFVSAGQHLTAGQLIAELDPESSEVALEQARATLQASEASLAQLEEDGGESTSGQGSSGAAGTHTATASAAPATATADAGTTGTAAGSSGAGGGTGSGAGTSTGTSGGGGTGGDGTSGGATSGGGTSGSHPAGAGNQGAGSTSRSAEGTTTSSAAAEKPKQSAATREANLSSARASVRSDRLSVQSAEQALADTRLYAPTSGSLVSLSGEVGEAVSGTGTTKSSDAGTGSSSSSASAAASRGGAGTGATGTGSSGGSGESGSGSSSTPFAVLSDLSALELVVPLSESEVTQVHVGQPATVTIEALEGAKVAAHVAEVASLATSNSGVVSYDVTFALDQSASGVKPGMSAAAEVVVKQEEGVNVPTRAISGSTVTVVHGDQRTTRRVVTGLAGNSSTIILRGLAAGEQVVLPVTSSSGATSLLSRLAGRGGLGGALGGGLGGGVGGGVAVTRGGG